MKTQLMALSLAATLLGFAPTGQHKPNAPSKPEKEHQWLHRFVGEWETAAEGTAGPGQPGPFTCQGKTTSRMLGGLWLVSETQNDVGGTTINAIQTIGYDPETKKYVGTFGRFHDQPHVEIRRNRRSDGKNPDTRGQRPQYDISRQGRVVSRLLRVQVRRSYRQHILNALGRRQVGSVHERKHEAKEVRNVDPTAEWGQDRHAPPRRIVGIPAWPSKGVTPRNGQNRTLRADEGGWP